MVADAALLTGPGQELLARLAGMDVGPDRVFAVSEALRAEYPAELVAAALTQQALRVAGRAKFGAADQMLFTRAGLEQASSELTAGHAAGRFAGARVVVDLCCGIGGNLVALARQAETDRVVIGVDRDLVSLEFARHNVAATAPAKRVGFVCADVRELPLTGVEAVFIDPARRDERGRLPAGKYQPELGWCLGLAATVPSVGIKAAPGLDRGRVPDGWETEFVAVGRELKEAMLWSPGISTGVVSRATVLPSGDSLTSARAAPASPASPTPRAPLAPPGEFLFDPSPAITRAGLVTDLGQLIGAWQIDPMIAFLSSDEPVRTPFARTLRVLESAPWHEKRFAARLRELGVGSADIRRRGLAGDVAQIHRRLGLGRQKPATRSADDSPQTAPGRQAPGARPADDSPRIALRGPGAATIVLTRVSDRPWGLICVPVDAAGPGPVF
ncbi:MAG TPA: class I SAM-dependent methyltransferase [Streptosporangiaceae bacterium]